MHRKVPDQHREYARDMRSDPTDAEAELWQAVKAKRLEGFKFKRQVPLDGYILDFVCFDAKLIVELDGSQHAENRRDETCDAHFRAAGFRVVRFWNDEILQNLDGACRHILFELKQNA